MILWKVMIVKVKITPNASEDKVVGFEGDILKVRVKAPPEDGKANYALIQLLAAYYKVPKINVIIKSGHTQRLKYVIIDQ